MEPPTTKHSPGTLPAHVVTILTIEHYNLQGGRTMTISEANGRASLFVGAVSSGLIALTFVGQISHLGLAFFMFNLVVLPTLCLWGCSPSSANCRRAVQMSSMRGASTVFAISIEKQLLNCNPISSSLPLMSGPSC